MEQARGNVARIKGRSDAKHVRVENALETEPRAEHVAIDADNAGHGAAVRVQCGRAVVRFRFQREQVVFVKLDNARIVFEHTDEPGHPLGHLVGNALDVCLE